MRHLTLFLIVFLALGTSCLSGRGQGSNAGATLAQHPDAIKAKQAIQDFCGPFADAQGTLEEYQQYLAAFSESSAIPEMPSLPPEAPLRSKKGDYQFYKKLKALGKDQRSLENFDGSTAVAKRMQTQKYYAEVCAGLHDWIAAVEALPYDDDYDEMSLRGVLHRDFNCKKNPKTCVKQLGSKGGPNLMWAFNLLKRQQDQNASALKTDTTLLLNAWGGLVKTPRGRITFTDPLLDTLTTGGTCRPEIAKGVCVQRKENLLSQRLAMKKAHGENIFDSNLDDAVQMLTQQFEDTLFFYTAYMRLLRKLEAPLYATKMHFAIGWRSLPDQDRAGAIRSRIAALDEEVRTLLAQRARSRSQWAGLSSAIQLRRGKREELARELTPGGFHPEKLHDRARKHSQLPVFQLLDEILQNREHVVGAIGFRNLYLTFIAARHQHCLSEKEYSKSPARGYQIKTKACDDFTSEWKVMPEVKQRYTEADYNNALARADAFAKKIPLARFKESYERCAQPLEKFTPVKRLEGIAAACDRAIALITPELQAELKQPRAAAKARSFKAKAEKRMKRAAAAEKARANASCGTLQKKCRKYISASAKYGDCNTYCAAINAKNRGGLDLGYSTCHEACFDQCMYQIIKKRCRK